MTAKEIAQIAASVLAEMVTAARADGVTFDAEQIGFIEQALSDTAQEVLNRALDGAASHKRGSE